MKYQIGQRVIIKETDQRGTLIELTPHNRPAKVKLERSGEIIDVIDKTIVVLTLLREILELLAAPFRKLFGL